MDAAKPSERAFAASHSEQKGSTLSPSSTLHADHCGTNWHHRGSATSPSAFHRPVSPTRARKSCAPRATFAQHHALLRVSIQRRLCPGGLVTGRRYEHYKYVPGWTHAYLRTYKVDNIHSLLPLYICTYIHVHTYKATYIHAYQPHLAL